MYLDILKIEDVKCYLVYKKYKHIILVYPSQKYTPKVQFLNGENKFNCAFFSNATMEIVI